MTTFLTQQQLDSIPIDLVQQWRQIHADHKIAVEAASFQDSIPPTFAQWATSAGLYGVGLRNLHETICSAHFKDLPALTVHEITKLKQRWGLTEWDLYFELGAELMGSRTSISALLALGKHFSGDGEESMRKSMEAVHEQRVLRRTTKSRTTKKDVSVLVPADAIKAADLVKSTTKKIQVNVSSLNEGSSGQTVKASSQTTSTVMASGIPKPADLEMRKSQIEVQIPADRSARRVSMRRSNKSPTDSSRTARAIKTTRIADSAIDAEKDMRDAQTSHRTDEDTQTRSPKEPTKAREDVDQGPNGEDPMEVCDDANFIDPFGPTPEDTIRVEDPATCRNEELMNAAPEPTISDAYQSPHESSASKPEHEPIQQVKGAADDLKRDPARSNTVDNPADQLPLPSTNETIKLRPAHPMHVYTDTTLSSPFEYQMKSRNDISLDQSKLRNLADVATLITTTVQTPPSNRFRHAPSSLFKRSSLLSSGIKAGEVLETPPHNITSECPGSIELGSPSFDRSRLSEPPSPSTRLSKNRPRSTSQAPGQTIYDSVMEEPFNVVLSETNNSISRKDLLTLDPEKSVNDEIINAYAVQVMKSHKSSEIHVANTFFYGRILSWLKEKGTAAYAVIPKMDRKAVPIFLQKYSVLPIHDNGNHWKLAILVDMPSLLKDVPKHIPTIFTVDSLDSEGNELNQDLVENLKEYVYESAAATKGNVRMQDIKWVHATDITQQQNGYDCGIYALMFLEMFAQDPADFLVKVENGQRIETPDATATRSAIRETFCKLVYYTLQAKGPTVDGDMEGDDDEMIEVPPHPRDEMETTIPSFSSPIGNSKGLKHNTMSEQARPPPFRLSSNQDKALRSTSALPPLANIPNKPLCPEPSLAPTTSPTLPRKRNRSSSPPRSSQRPRITPTPTTPSTIVDTELCTDSIRTLSQQIETLSQKLARKQTAITETLASLHAEKAASPAVIQAIEAEMATKTAERVPFVTRHDFLVRKKRVRALSKEEEEELGRLERGLEMSFSEILALEDRMNDVLVRGGVVGELIREEEGRLVVLEKRVGKIEKMRSLAGEMVDVWSGKY